MPSPSWWGTYVPMLLQPSYLMFLAMYHFFVTAYEVVFVEQRPSELFNISELRLKSFARLWKYEGQAMSDRLPGPMDDILKSCSGLVLDIGPASGEILPRFDPAKIHAIYGAEPAIDLHPQLLRNAEKFGFGQKYHALVCGGEPETLIPALHKSGVLGKSGTGGTAEDGVFDAICCVRVLCGVPHPEETIKSLYALLKPGGKMVVCEHVVAPWRTNGRVLARLVQFWWTLCGWPFFMAGCKVQRHTELYLKEAGPWEKFELEWIGPNTALPFVVGELVKPAK